MSSPEPYRALREGAGLVARPERGHLRLTGADRRTYLQGLLTNDIVALGPGRGCYAAWLTAQGRMIADMRVLETGDDVLVDLDRTLAATVADRWEQVIFSEDVAIADVSGATAEFGVYGPNAPHVVAALCGQDAAALAALPIYGNRRADAGLLVRSDEIGIDGFDVVVPVALADELVRRALEAGAVAIDPLLAEAVRIESGRPRFLVDMDESTIPLEAGIEGRAISMSKGCYVGQEVIVRVLHRGHGRVARRLVRLTFGRDAELPSRGDAIAAGGKPVGQVTSAAMSPSSHTPVALGYVHRDVAATGVSVEVRGAPALVSLTLEP